MNDNDYNQIEVLKNIARSLQEFANSIDAVKTGYIIEKAKYKKLLESYSMPDIISDPHIESLKNTLLTYDKANTDDKLRLIYSKLDEVQAEYTATSIPTTEVEQTESEDVPEKCINSLCDKGVNKDNIRIISSLKEYIEFIHDLDLGYLSRGQENCEWPLLPSALRTENGVRIYNDDEIHQMIDEFKKSLAYYDKLYTNNQKNDLEIMAYAQHYSIPTNLLDFTESHLASLLFALENYNSPHCAIIYFVDAKTFNSRRCGKENIPNCSEDKDKCDGGASSIFIKSDNVNERIHFQKGYFLKTPNHYDKLDVLSEIKDFCKIILVPSECKYDVLQDLFKMGIGFQNIYPDLDNIAKTIKFRIRMMREV